MRPNNEKKNDHQKQNAQQTNLHLFRFDFVYFFVSDILQLPTKNN